jgi:hypothetical protein
MTFPYTAVLAISSVVSLTLLYNNLRAVIPAKAGIQVEKTGFPRVKHGAGLIKSGMTRLQSHF